MLDVDEAGLCQVLPSKNGSMSVGAKLGKRLEHQFGEPLEGPVVRDRIVVGMDISVYILYLDPATGLDIAKFRKESVCVPIFHLQRVFGNDKASLVCLLEQRDGRLHHWYHVAQVDKVPVIAVEPLGLHIVNEKLDVWRHPAGLNGTQVNSQNFSTRIFVAHCHPVLKNLFGFHVRL